MNNSERMRSGHTGNSLMFLIMDFNTYSLSKYIFAQSTHNDQTLLRELVVWDLQVKRCRTLTDSAAGVIMASMAGAVVASKLSSVSNGDAAKVGAHAQDDQPLRFLHPLSVRLGIPKSSRVHCRNISNLLGGPVPDEQGLATPLEGHVLALRDVPQLHLNLGQGQHILRRAPGHDKVAYKGLGSIGTSQSKTTSHDIAVRHPVSCRVPRLGGG